MDGTSLDSMCLSTYPVEQYIALKEDTDHDTEKSIPRLEHPICSVDCCTQKVSNDDLDAGANAGLRDAITFENNNPPSELVWSPPKGLSVKCTDRSLMDKKSNLFWHPEPRNMIISSPTNIKAREINNNVNIDSRDVRLTQLAPTPLTEDSKTFRSETNTEDWFPPSQMQTPKQNKRSYQEMEPLTTINGTVAEVRSEDDLFAKNEMHIPSSPADVAEVCEERRVIHATSPKKDYLPAAVKKTNTALPVELKDAKHGLFAIKPQIGDSAKKRDTTLFKSSTRVSDESSRAFLVDAFQCDPSNVKECNLQETFMPILRSPDRYNIDRDSCTEVGYQKKKTINPNPVKTLFVDQLELTGKQKDVLCSEYSSCKSVAVGGNNDSEIGMVVAHGEEGKVFAKNLLVSLVGSEKRRKDNGAASATFQNNRKKDKGRALSDTEVDHIISKGKDSSHDSNESCNGGFLSRRKRAWSFEQQLIIGSKKFKKQQHESLHSTSFFREGSSLLNWITNMTKRFPKSDADGEPSLALTFQPSQQRCVTDDFASSELDKNQNLPTLCRPGIQLKEKKTENFPGAKGATRSKEFENVEKILIDSSLQGDLGRGTVKFKNFIPILNDKNEVGQCQLQPTIAFPEVLENPESFLKESYNVCSSVHGLEVSGSGTRLECEGPREVVIVDPSKYSDSVTNKNKSQASLWIARFSPKVNGPMSNLMQANQEKAEDIVDNKLFPHSHNLVFPAADLNKFEINHEPSVEIDGNAQSRNLQNHLVSSSIPFGSKIAEVAAKPESKLSSILPSKIFNEAHGDTLCYYCGIYGHTLRNCSQTIGSEMELVKSIDLHDGTKEVLRLCIKCFQQSHWAVACPVISSRKLIDNSSKASLDDTKPSTQIPQCSKNLSSHTNRDSKKVLQSNVDPKGRCGDACTALNEDSSKEKVELMVETDASRKVSSMMFPNGRVPDLKHLKYALGDDCRKGVTRTGNSFEFLLMDKSTAPTSKSELRETQIATFRNHEDIPEGTLEAVRKLCLSRTDILKWMETQSSCFSLEGYFLKFRLGKWEEGLGGTGYHMARICASSQKKSCDICKVPISVDIGGLKCLVDCRCVSNHDIIEDELMAWWFATLRGDGRVPSKEELSLKLVERKRYGF